MLALGPPIRSAGDRMSCSSGPSVHTGMGHHATLPHLNAEVSNSVSGSASTNTSETPASTKRSEVLRHVFARPSRGDALVTQKIAPRVTKPEHHKGALSSIRQSKSRVAFHRVFTSIFSNNSVRATPHSAHHQAGSSTSNTPSRPGSIDHDSIPNLEVVSPGTFLFSGPSLKSTCSSTLKNSTSRLPSLTQNGSETWSRRRAHSKSFSIDNVSLWDDGVLEPFIESGITRTMSDVLLGISTPFEESQGPILEDLNEDAHFIPVENAVQSPSRSLCPLPIPVARLLLPYLDFSSWKAIRLTSREWHSILNFVAPPKFPSSYGLPTEILQSVYNYLGPRDLNAARHTCSTWMRASLNKNLLVTMLKRGGWWSSAKYDLDRRNHITTRTSDEWFLSRRLSRECSLSGNWTGNGLDTSSGHDTIVEVSQTDFADLVSGYAGPGGRHTAGLVFTTSICGRYLLVAEGGMIYVYELQGHGLRPLTSVVCPRRVLAMSMDASSGRTTVAALLEGRMGMVCDLRFGCDIGTDTFLDARFQSRGRPHRATTKASILTNRASEPEVSMDVAERSSTTTRRSNRLCGDEQETSHFDAVDVQANYEVISLQGTDDHSTYNNSQINHEWNINLRGTATVSGGKINTNSTSSRARSIPIESGSSTFYRYLCQEDDPPRSVSICPQRRCVAFGCSSGIELHWVDALTGQSLSRWFPLTGPSEFLYFLPPRPGFESAKKLRLISSAAHPHDRPSICRRFFSSPPTLTLFREACGLENFGSCPGIPSCDHYRAVPLSDGYHVLFIDPPTGKLFLGCDTLPRGPAKLLRKILFIPSEDGQLPRLYTAAADLSSGARVAVVFGDTVVLYSVPPDVFALSRLEQQAEGRDVYSAPPFSTEGRSGDHWLNWWDESYTPYLPDRSPIWPLAIHGTTIGSLQGVCELAIFTHPDVTIWAFALDEQSKAWQVRNEAEPVNISRRFISRSGIVQDSYSLDESGDVIMRDVDHQCSLVDDPDVDVERSVGFDGHSSQVIARYEPKALHIEKDAFLYELYVRGKEAWYDRDGDVVVFDADDGMLVEFAGWQS
ncbi:hypothetical protein K469DRAFT_750598 [Zopfia rhizophila CBS 207.26]|uniref:F-box domain-containing protein n=1 Tax=Zopfia rhizophila CBS 207.26 TaxID=1314779 RepID=A0A6A6E3C5_9PEZI|nr:hypothetical protein K469DRAFT_750598 [Zopfia rhizophila CBS 207.26]